MKKKSQRKRQQRRQPPRRLSPRPHVWIAIAAAVVIAGGAALVYGIAAVPIPVLYVEEGSEQLWRRIAGAQSRWRIMTYASAPHEAAVEKLPARYYGFTVSRDGPAPEQEAGGLRVYPWLSGAGMYRDAIALAVNPWMAFRKAATSALSRGRIETEGGADGVLLLPGAAEDAVYAWVSQLAQEEPGAFSEGRLEAALGRLFTEYPFQQGARTYTWSDVWNALFDDKPAWVYAPLAMALEQSARRLAPLAADRFPERRTWHTFGIEADVLWAVPLANNQKHAKKAEEMAAFLKAPSTHTALADNMRWIPASREGKPYNNLARQAQLAWLAASFVWQTPPSGIAGLAEPSGE